MMTHSLNQGIGGNRLLIDGLGPSALSRFDHDVLAQAGARYLIVLEGINDIGMLARAGDTSPAAHDLLVQHMIGAYEQIIARAHTSGIQVIGETIMPFTGSQYYHPGAPSEADRQAVNRWKDDAAEVKRLEDSYLKAAEESIGYYRGMSHTLYGRDIAYVLLMHIGAFDAEMLPRLLDLYRSKGFEFVSLPEAERDDFYRSSIDLTLPAEPDMLEQVMRARHLELPTRTDFAPQLESVCR
jgi:hypothetical protein